MSSIPARIKAGYGISEIGVTGMVVFGSFYIFSYMTNTLGIPVGIAGTIFLATKLFDVLTDPLVGYLSDRTNTRIGPRRPWMLAGAFVMGPALAIAFYAPFSTESWGANAAWFSAFLMLSYLGLTMIGVPFGAMTAEMTEDYDERTSITAWRMWIGTIGILFGAAGYAILTGNFGNLSIEGYRTGMLSILPLLMIPTLITVFATRNAPVNRTTLIEHGFFDGIKIVWTSKSFLIIAGSYILMISMITVVTSNVNALIEYLLVESQDIQPTLSAMLLFPTFLTLPFWVWLGKHVEKRTGMVIGGVMYAIGMACVYFVGEGDTGLLMIILAFMGVAYGAYQIFPWAMLPDVISEAQEKHGGSLAGLFNGWWTTAQKFGIALGPFLAGVILQSGGFKSSVGGQLVEQSDVAINTLRLTISLLPAGVFVLGVLLILAYPISRSDQNARSDPQ
jgi:GPH family glycoside/pentoside/hexuronide:cation symporter